MAFYREYLRSRKGLPKHQASAPISSDMNLDEVETFYGWKERLLDLLRRLDPSAFERLCQIVLRESGFDQVEITARPGDGGIDGKAILRLNGLVGFSVMFQCKRYAGSVSPSVVRDFRGGIPTGIDKGIIITTGNFTKAARDGAVEAGMLRIDLVDGEALADKLKELGLGVKVEMVESVDIDEGWFEKI